MQPARTLAAALLALLVVAGAPASAQQGAPLQLAPAKKLAPPRAVSPKPATALDRDDVLAKANAWFNNATTMVADFVQLGGDGRRTEGRLSIQRPGRLRFEYDPPATIEIIADGTSVAVKDRKLRTQDNYFIGQTPLKFLLSDHIDLARDTKVLDVTRDANSLMILIEDKQTFGGTSRIRLVFDPASYELKQWTVTDPQGYETVVSLFNTNLAEKPDPAIFRINNERLINNNR